MADFNPGLIMMIGGLATPFLSGLARRLWLLALPAAGLAYTIALDPGDASSVLFLGYTLEVLRVDKLSLLWGYIFHIAAFLGVLYAIHEDDPVQAFAAQVYMGSATAAIFAGDLITLFVFWEITAITSVFLIWASRTERAYSAGMRYLIIQVGSGVLLLAGAILYQKATGSLAFNHIGLESLPGMLIFLAFGIKCAFPLLHNWLQDSYPEATVSGTVILSAFTTKLAVYALARGYAGTEVLIYIGAAMTAFPVFFAVIENNLRRVLAYSLNNQLGFMVCGIGLGSELAINGAAGHAFAHILYKALLFMSMGAVLFRAGTIKASELGGLYKSMPWTAGFCIVGAMSISAFPIFSGFVTKSMVLTAAAEQGRWIVWGVLLMASAGVMEHSGIKIPYFAFFAHDSGRRVKEAPLNMLIAMGLAAFLCIGIGVYPDPLYALLPYPVDYHPYTAGHVITSLQLLVFATLAFIVLIKTGLYPPETPSLNLDFDWTYRRLLPGAVRATVATFGPIDRGVREWAVGGVRRFIATLQNVAGPGSLLAKASPAGAMAAWVLVLLVVYMVMYFLG